MYGVPLFPHIIIIITAAKKKKQEIRVSQTQEKEIK